MRSTSQAGAMVLATYCATDTPRSAAAAVRGGSSPGAGAVLCDVATSLTPAAFLNGQIRCNYDTNIVGSFHHMPFSPGRIERVAVFIDGVHLYTASRALGFDVDYKNLLAHFRQPSHLI